MFNEEVVNELLTQTDEHGQRPHDCFAEVTRDENTGALSLVFRRRGALVDGQAFYCIAERRLVTSRDCLFYQVASSTSKLKLFAVQSDSFHHTGSIECGFCTVKRSIGTTKLRNIHPNTPYLIALAVQADRVSRGQKVHPISTANSKPGEGSAATGGETKSNGVFAIRPSSSSVNHVVHTITQSVLLRPTSAHDNNHSNSNSPSVAPFRPVSLSNRPSSNESQMNFIDTDRDMEEEAGESRDDGARKSQQQQQPQPRSHRNHQKRVTSISSSQSQSQPPHLGNDPIPFVEHVQLRELQEKGSRARAVYHVVGRNPWSDPLIPSKACVAELVQHWVKFLEKNGTAQKLAKASGAPSPSSSSAGDVNHSSAAATHTTTTTTVRPVLHTSLTIHGVADPLCGFFIAFVQLMRDVVVAHRLQFKHRWEGVLGGGGSKPPFGPPPSAGDLLDALAVLGSHMAHSSLSAVWSVDWFLLLLFVTLDQGGLKRASQVGQQYKLFDIEGQMIEHRLVWMLRPEKRNALPTGSMYKLMVTEAARHSSWGAAAAVASGGGSSSSDQQSYLKSVDWRATEKLRQRVAEAREHQRQQQQQQQLKKRNAKGSNSEASEAAANNNLTASRPSPNSLSPARALWCWMTHRQQQYAMMPIVEPSLLHQEIQAVRPAMLDPAIVRPLHREVRLAILRRRFRLWDLFASRKRAKEEFLARRAQRRSTIHVDGLVDVLRGAVNDDTLAAAWNRWILFCTDRKYVVPFAEAVQLRHLRLRFRTWRVASMGQYGSRRIPAARLAQLEAESLVSHPEPTALVRRVPTFQALAGSVGVGGGGDESSVLVLSYTLIAQYKTSVKTFSRRVAPPQSTPNVQSCIQRQNQLADVLELQWMNAKRFLFRSLRKWLIIHKEHARLLQQQATQREALRRLMRTSSDASWRRTIFSDWKAMAMQRKHLDDIVGVVGS